MRNQDESKNSNNLFSFFPGYPNLNKFSAEKLRKLEQIYYDSDDITLYEFNKFLKSLLLFLSSVTVVLIISIMRVL